MKDHAIIRRWQKVKKNVLHLNVSFSVEILEEKNCPKHFGDMNLIKNVPTIRMPMGVNGAFVVFTSDVMLDVNIRRSGHPSYGSDIFLAGPRDLQRINVTSGQTNARSGAVSCANRWSLNKNRVLVSKSGWGFSDVLEHDNLCS